jgi:Flp pilus assembly protein TadD
MKNALIPFAALVIAASASAQTSIFRCPGNVYTNSQAEAQAKGCKVVEGGNVTVVTGTRVNGAAASSGVKVVNAPPSAASGPKVDAGEQKARDSDARAILEAELKKAETRQAELLKEFNNGEPDKLGPEARNHQKYLDRVAELKASIERNEKDIAGLKRELGRSSGTAAK